jgi:DNA mismatch repair protein MLH1
MLKEYFSICINCESNELIGLPEIFPGYRPIPESLSIFLLHLATDVNWNIEQECFDDIAQILSEFYSQFAFTQDQCDKNNEESVDETKMQISNKSIVESDNLSNIIGDTFWPIIRKFLIPSRDLLDSRTIIQIASLEQLYKVFERC